MALTDKLTAIADAIRDKTGIGYKMSLEQMPPFIRSITDGSLGEYNIAMKYDYYDYMRTGYIYFTSVVAYPNFINYDAFDVVHMFFLEHASLTQWDNFANISKIQTITFEKGAELSDKAFDACTGLQEVTFEPSARHINSIDSTAFSGCNNLTAINVPWSEGEVANAPWGAVNATINYNYTN